MLYKVDNVNEYYKVVQLKSTYSDGKSFPINEVVTADKKINFNTTDPKEVGGFCVSNYKCIFRWLIRGDTLCKVKIPEDGNIYQAESENGIYIADKIILTDPITLDDNLATKLYYDSKLPEVSYFITLAVCSIKGYINTALLILSEKINENNVDEAIHEFDEYCKRREKEYRISTFEIETVKLIRNKLEEIKK